MAIASPGGIGLPSIYTDIEIRYDKLDTQLEEVASKIDDKSKQISQNSWNVQKTSQDLKQVGSNLTKYITAPLGAGAIASGKFAMDFESAFAGVKKTVDATEQQYEQLKQGIRDMAKELPASAEEIAGVAEAAGQLGVANEYILGFTRVMIDLGESTNLSAEQGATQLSRFANITRMSQQDFDRLGSVIVDLGNNFATTEAEIVDLGMRLAGAGSQIGLTEPQIMALSTALSSVGIEAEAGGSAFSKLMINMDVASTTGSKANDVIASTGYSLRDLQMMASHNAAGFSTLANSMDLTTEELKSFVDASATLEGFSKVTGKTAQEFKSAWEEDATGAIMEFINGLATAEDRGQSAIEILDEMGISEVRLRDTILRATGATELFEEALRTGNIAWEENTALADEANQRYATTESQMLITKNRIKDLAIDIGEKLLPTFSNILEKVDGLVDNWNSLDQNTKDLIITLSGVAIVAGPATKALGGLLSIGSKLVPITTKIGVASAAAGGTGGLGALGTGLVTATTAAAPYLTAAGAVALTGYAIYDSFQQKATPAVNKLADGFVKTGSTLVRVDGQIVESASTASVKISENTKAQMAAYYELSDSAQQATMELYAGILPLTAESTAKIQTDVRSMADTTIAAIEEQKNKNIQDFESIFSTSTSLTAEEKSMVLQDVESMAEGRKEKVENMRDRIIELYEDIKVKGIENASEEKEELDRLYQEMSKEQIKAVAQSANEQELLVNNLVNNNTQITSKMVEETIQKLNQQRDEGIKATEQQYDQMIKTAAAYKTNIEIEHGKMSSKQKEIYEKMVQDANSFKTKTTDAYKQVRDNGIYTLNKAYPELTKTIDIETGKQMSAMEQIFSGTKKNVAKINGLKYDNKSYTVTRNEVTNKITRLYEYTYADRRVIQQEEGRAYQGHKSYSFRAGGLDFVPYDGYLARLHRGERILTAAENKNLEEGIGDINIQIDKVENNTKEDVRRLARRLADEIKRNKLGREGII